MTCHIGVPDQRCLLFLQLLSQRRLLSPVQELSLAELRSIITNA